MGLRARAGEIAQAMNIDHRQPCRHRRSGAGGEKMARLHRMPVGPQGHAQRALDVTRPGDHIQDQAIGMSGGDDKPVCFGELPDGSVLGFRRPEARSEF